MSTERAMRRYRDLCTSDTFARYEKDFAGKLNSALAEGYSQALHEEPLVSSIEKVVNGLNGLTIGDPVTTSCGLSTRAVFIHGNRSRVEFDCYGQSMQRELGDLVFIITVVLDGQKYFERLTISQFKRNQRSAKTESWIMDNKEQLFLLSRFPAFRGVTGLIPKKVFNLLDLSGCLGSYGLLFRPGDFVFVSATKLGSFLGQRNTLKTNEAYNLASGTEPYRSPYPQYFHPGIDELLDLMHIAYGRGRLGAYLPWDSFSNYHHACNTFDFAHKYLTMGIGEPVFIKAGIDNPGARAFLNEWLSAALIKAKREGAEALEECVDGFFGYTYSGCDGEDSIIEDVEFDLEGGGLGIIHTTVDLGE